MEEPRPGEKRKFKEEEEEAQEHTHTHTHTASSSADLSSSGSGTGPSTSSSSAAAAFPFSSSSSTSSGRPSKRPLLDLPGRRDSPNTDDATSRPVSLCANFFALQIHENLSKVEQYAVSFEPNPEDTLDVSLKRRILARVRAQLKALPWVFDGSSIFVQQPLDLGPSVPYLQEVEIDGARYVVTIKPTNFDPYKNEFTMQFLLNIIFKKLLHHLDLVQMRRDVFDPTKTKRINEYKIDLWPGFRAAIGSYQAGVLLNVDSIFKIVHQQTVLDVIAHRSRSEAIAAVENQIVVTTYGTQRSYRVTGIDFDMNPNSKFQKRIKGSTHTQEISFRDYFSSAHIRDMDQPLLIVDMNRRKPGTGERETQRIYLLPELCRLTGLDDRMANDYRVMKAVHDHTCISPASRVEGLEAFAQQFRAQQRQQRPPSRTQDEQRYAQQRQRVEDVISNWGLEVKNMVSLTGRQLHNERLLFGNRQCKETSRGSWSNVWSSRPSPLVINPKNLENWVIFYERSKRNLADDLVHELATLAEPMGFRVSSPHSVEVPSFSDMEYVRDTIKRNVNQRTTLALFVLPTSNKYVYDSIKQCMTTITPCPSQCVTCKLLTGPSGKRRSACTKLVQQMLCKIGGALWGVSQIALPSPSMIVGIDVSHNKINGGMSIASFVASMDEQCTQYWSKALVMPSGQLLADGIAQCMEDALEAFKDFNSGCPPKAIVVYREGVSDGQIPALLETEIAAMTKAAMEVKNDINITVILVKRKVNARFFLRESNRPENPLPGTVIDTCVTRTDQNDFYLISQHANQGTVSPTHYVVIKDVPLHKVSTLQRLTYQLCHLYYNWSGTVSVPAPLQYARKLAFLTAQSTREAHLPRLSRLGIFYL